jgi:hypothetical protein
MSPTLFLVFINDILTGMSRKVKGAIYADDLVLWCSTEKIELARAEHTQQAAALDQEMAIVSVNATKTVYTIFCLSPKLQKAKLTLSGQILKLEESQRLTFDHRLT